MTELDAVRRALEAAAKAQEDFCNDQRGEHWVFAAAEAHTPFLARLALEHEARDDASSLGWNHLTWMVLQIRGRKFSATKACRWLGWIQAALVSHGVATLDEMKAINKSASDASDVQQPARAEGPIFPNGNTAHAEGLSAADQWRLATPAETLRVLAARLSEQLSPAEKREIAEAATYLEYLEREVEALRRPTFPNGNTAGPSAVEEPLPASVQKEIDDHARWYGKYHKLGLSARDDMMHIAALARAAERESAATPNETVLQTIRRVLDESSAWIAMPNKDVEKRLAIASGFVWQAELDRLRAERSAALDLLAVIHRDGGHYTEVVGFIKSCADAIETRTKLVLELDRLRAEVERLKDELSREHVISSQQFERAERAEDALREAMDAVRKHNSAISNDEILTMLAAAKEGKS